MDKALCVSLAKAGSVYQNCAFSDSAQAVILAPNVGGVTQNKIQYANKAAYRRPGGVNCYDNDFDGVTAMIANTGTTQSTFLIETFVSVEVRPNASTPYQAFTREPPPRNQQVLDAASAARKLNGPFYVEHDAMKK